MGERELLPTFLKVSSAQQAKAVANIHLVGRSSTSIRAASRRGYHPLTRIAWLQSWNVAVDYVPARKESVARSLESGGLQRFSQNRI